MKQILIAADKFKGSLTASQVCDAVAAGLLRGNRSINIEYAPMADGGEGTMSLLTLLNNGSVKITTVKDPLFNPTNASYSISADGSTAFIEMSQASGLNLVPIKLRNPANTTTVGTGQLIAAALDKGVSNIVLGLGGSATNDGGIGMASALGYEFLDNNGNPLTPIGANLVKIATIKTNNVHPRLASVKITALCDVDNPLHGHDGAAWVYGPQKGGDTSILTSLDNGLKHLDTIVADQLQVSMNFPGAGAAGGMGGGCVAFLRAAVRKGIDYMMEKFGLHEKIRMADVVITGEGKLDSQSLRGKVVATIAQVAASMGKEVIAVCGKNELMKDEYTKCGIRHVITLVDELISDEEAIANAFELLVQKVDREIRL